MAKTVGWAIPTSVNGQGNGVNQQSGNHDTDCLDFPILRDCPEMEKQAAQIRFHRFLIPKILGLQLIKG